MCVGVCGVLYFVSMLLSVCLCCLIVEYVCASIAVSVVTLPLVFSVRLLVTAQVCACVSVLEYICQSIYIYTYIYPNVCGFVSLSNVASSTQLYSSLLRMNIDLNSFNSIRKREFS